MGSYQMTGRRLALLLDGILLLLILGFSTGCGADAGPTPAGAPASAPVIGTGGTAPSGPVAAATAAAATAAPADSGGLAPANYQSPLLAGQVDDNAKFAEYLDYLHRYQGPPVHPVAVDRRLFVRVLDAQQQPVAGARVQLFDGARPVFDGRTVSDGRVLFFPAAAGAIQTTQFRALVSRGQQQVEVSIPAGAPETSVSLPKLADNTGPVSLDLVFLLDSTGSMGDEIETVKATVDSIAARIEQLLGSSRPRFGLVTFRDRGDDYITRAWDFTADMGQFSANLAQVEAGGGGDNPESVNAGLHDAIHLPGWASAETGRHLRMIVLVGDAPPHLDYANDYEYTALLGEAVAAGIKIFPVGASGLDAQGEYIFRQFAQQTQGQFVFVTYANGVSGAPGTGTTNHVTDYTVHNLDGVVVQLVAGEIANQVGRGQTGAVPPGAAAGVLDSGSEPRLAPVVAGGAGSGRPPLPPAPSGVPAMGASSLAIWLRAVVEMGARLFAEMLLALLLIVLVAVGVARALRRPRPAQSPVVAFESPPGPGRESGRGLVPGRGEAARVADAITTVLPAALIYPAPFEGPPREGGGEPVLLGRPAAPLPHIDAPAGRPV